MILPNTKGVIVGKAVISKAMKRFNWADAPATPHDLRRTAITEISKLGFDRLIQDKIANHVDKSIGGIYDQYSYEKEKRVALESWGRKLTEIITGQTGSNVIPLHRLSV